MHVFRWDLDKTYLDTDIDSVRGLLRAAVQTAREKRNVPGSAALVRALQQHDPEARVFVLSGSPTQMRSVLEEKLALDGLHVDQLVLKDNLGNLRRGRLRAVRDQLGYKLPNLLVARAREDRSVSETLFGDDSEVDALVYAAYAGVIDGSVDRDTLAHVLTLGNVYSDARDTALEAAGRIAQADAVEDIFIRVEKGVPLARFDLLAGRVTPVFSWLQAALALDRRGRLSRAHTVDVIRACADEASLAGGAIAGLFQDAVRRGITTADDAGAIARDPSLSAARDNILRAIDRLAGTRDPAPSRTTPDWAGFVRYR
ncbi:MAG: hypothetical protein H6736_21215 [Alphaproteobacteria bacterium]|nr:hypothetical protein [Alphaproteobacteria bacterium]MCB9694338.1 hypothetical protein [Alphaproteobacteria bacterium]